MTLSLILFFRDENFMRFLFIKFVLIKFTFLIALLQFMTFDFRLEIYVGITHNDWWFLLVFFPFLFLFNPWCQILLIVRFNIVIYFLINNIIVVIIILNIIILVFVIRIAPLDKSTIKLRFRTLSRKVLIIIVVFRWSLEMGRGFFDYIWVRVGFFQWLWFRETEFFDFLLVIDGFNPSLEVSHYMRVL